MKMTNLSVYHKERRVTTLLSQLFVDFIKMLSNNGVVRKYHPTSYLYVYPTQHRHSLPIAEKKVDGRSATNHDYERKKDQFMALHQFMLCNMNMIQAITYHFSYYCSHKYTRSSISM